MTQPRDDGQPQPEVTALLHAVGQLLVALSGSQPSGSQPSGSQPSGNEPAASAPPEPEPQPAGPPLEEVEQILADARERARQLIDESFADARERIEALTSDAATPGEPVETEQREEASELDEKLRSLQQLLSEIDALQQAGEAGPAAPEALAGLVQPEASEARGEPEEPAAQPDEQPAAAAAAEQVEAVAWSEDGAEDGARFRPEDGSVLLQVAPVDGFRGLLRVQGALGQLPGVRQAAIEGYAEGEAQLRLTFDSAVAVDAFGGALGERLGVVVQAVDVSEAGRSVRFELR